MTKDTRSCLSTETGQGMDIGPQGYYSSTNNFNTATEIHGIYTYPASLAPDARFQSSLRVMVAFQPVILLEE